MLTDYSFYNLLLSDVFRRVLILIQNLEYFKANLIILL